MPILLEHEVEPKIGLWTDLLERFLFPHNLPLEVLPFLCHFVFLLATTGERTKRVDVICKFWFMSEENGVHSSVSDIDNIQWLCLTHRLKLFLPCSLLQRASLNLSVFFRFFVYFVFIVFYLLGSEVLWFDLLLVAAAATALNCNKIQLKQI